MANKDSMLSGFAEPEKLAMFVFFCLKFSGLQFTMFVFFWFKQIYKNIWFS